MFFRVFPGNTADPSALTEAVETVRAKTAQPASLRYSALMGG